MDTIKVINHIYSHRPRNAKAEARQTPMNEAMLKAAIERIQRKTDEKEV